MSNDEADYKIWAKTRLLKPIDGWVERHTEETELYSGWCNTLGILCQTSACVHIV